MTNSASGSDPRALRRKRLVWFGSALALLGMSSGAWILLSNPALRTTDDAYVGGHIVTLTPEISGTITRIQGDNTDFVRAGAPLVLLDQSDARIELALAEAQLAQAVRGVRGLFSNGARFDADVQVRQAELKRAEGDLQVRQTLVSSGVVSREDLRHAADALSTAQAALASAQHARAQAFALVAGSTLISNPAVQIAAERVRAAALALNRTQLTSPVSGMVAQRSAQLGQRVSPGEKLMAVIPLDQLWIDANFKEVQLRGVCAGQPARITADIYGRSIIYHGQVAGVEAGTGAAFALLPAQNATGNWIKVVQRAPVRISLDPNELATNPLRIGMSAEVEIDTTNCEPPAAGRERKGDDAASIYEAQARAADDRVAKIVESNIGVER